jgi:sugar porter (SP) family MFS transporter
MTETNEKGSFAYVLLICLVAALGGLLFGYDTGVISGAIGPLEERFALDAKWTGWAASCALVGCMFGAAFAGTISDYLGRKRVLVLSAVLFFVSALGTALPRNLTEFIIFRFIGGLGVGAASLTSPMYIAEITPARIRGRMVSVNQFAIVSGFLVVYFVNYFIALGRQDSWIVQTGWRWMFGSEAIPAALLLVLAFFVPESPRWLTKQGRGHEALRILSRVDGPQFAQAELQEIKQAIAHESGSLRQLFRPGMKIVLVIGVALAILQQVTGINAVLYYAPEIFKNLGSRTQTALLQTVIIGAVNIGFTVVAIWTVDRLGRKPLMTVGAAGMGLTLTALGLAFYGQRSGLWVLICILAYIACFASSLGPVTWVILSEIFPTRIRGRAMAIATVILWVACYLVSQTFPMMDKNRWLIDQFHHGFSFWVYAAFCLVEVLFVWRFVPETKGKTLEEIERHWIENGFSGANKNCQPHDRDRAPIL